MYISLLRNGRRDAWKTSFDAFSPPASQCLELAVWQYKITYTQKQHAIAASKTFDSAPSIEFRDALYSAHSLCASLSHSLPTRSLFIFIIVTGFRLLNFSTPHSIISNFNNEWNSRTCQCTSVRCCRMIYYIGISVSSITADYVLVENNIAKKRCAGIYCYIHTKNAIAHATKYSTLGR